MEPKKTDRRKWIIALLVMIVAVILALSLWQKPEPSPPEIRTAADLIYLEHTEHFQDECISHIFLGTLSAEGKASGYHYDGIEDSPGEIVEGSRSEPDEHGVYTAKVKVGGKGKAGNRGYSTFYPDDFTPQQVIDAINQAYENKELLNGSLYAGITEEGIEIDMALDEEGKIITAYPVKEE